jgi:hypothetical protein
MRPPRLWISRELTVDGDGAAGIQEARRISSLGE